MAANRSSAVGSVFGAYCKLNEQERVEFQAMVEAVNIHARAQQQSEAGRKAATTRKQRQPASQPPKVQSVGGEAA